MIPNPCPAAQGSSTCDGLLNSGICQIAADSRRTGQTEDQHQGSIVSPFAQRFAAAVQTLIGDGPVKQRLASAYSQHLAELTDTELPAGFAAGLQRAPGGHHPRRPGRQRDAGPRERRRRCRRARPRPCSDDRQALRRARERPRACRAVEGGRAAPEDPALSNRPAVSQQIPETAAVATAIKEFLRALSHDDPRLHGLIGHIACRPALPRTARRRAATRLSRSSSRCCFRAPAASRSMTRSRSSSGAPTASSEWTCAFCSNSNARTTRWRTAAT